MSQTTLPEAKEKFIRAADAACPSHWIKAHPFGTLFVALALGTVVGTTRKLSGTLLSLLKKLV